MLAKKFALGFGIAVIFPVMIHYAVSTFSVQPKWEDYHDRDYYQRHQDATGEEKEALRKEENVRRDEWEKAQGRFQRHLFYVAIPVGIVAIIIGAMISVQAIGTGLMFGGIFTLMDGYVCYWSQLPDWMRFVSLLAAFVVLLGVGYRKFAPQAKT